MEPKQKESNNVDVQKTPAEDGTVTEEAKLVCSSFSSAASFSSLSSSLDDEEEKGSPPAPPLPNSSEPSEMKCPPPVQTMEQSPGYDPNRIPVSIFSTKVGNAEWSAASNDSLFSIHMGNNSICRDYSILFGKSGELPKFEDWNNDNNLQSSSNNPFAKSGELPRLSDQPKPSNEFGSNLPPVMEHEETNRSIEFAITEDNKNTTDHNKSPNHVPAVEAAAKKPPLPESSHLSSSSNPLSSPSHSRLSDVSGHSSSSFAFPVLASESGKNDSLKVAPEKPEQQQQQQQEPPPADAQAQASTKETPNVSGTRWFACFSCWPRFC